MFLNTVGWLLGDVPVLLVLPYARAREGCPAEHGWAVVDRIARRPNGRFYELSGRVKCGHCGAAMAALVRDGAVEVVLAYALDRLSRDQVQVGVLLFDLQRADARLDLWRTSRGPRSSARPGTDDRRRGPRRLRGVLVASRSDLIRPARRVL